MTVATISFLLSRSDKKKTDLYIGCAAEKAMKVAPSLSTKPFPIWGGVFMPFRFLKELELINPSQAFVMGADIMDGYYSPVTSMRMIIAADIMSRYGTKVSFLGFSLNNKPYWILKYMFRALHAEVNVNLRDPLSYERFRRIINRQANLVADTAFLLKPNYDSNVYNKVSSWVTAEKARGHVIIGVNFHPMLFRGSAASSDFEMLSQSFMDAIRKLSISRKISWLFLPHDDREEAGDVFALGKLYSELEIELNEMAHLVVPPPSAAELKAITGLLNGVITGRMHLAIATLGMGVPILALAYQGKFEGLSKHFELPSWVVMDPHMALNSDFLIPQIEKFINELDSLRSQVTTKLPEVKDRSLLTFRNIK